MTTSPMLRHLVLCTFSDDASETDLARIVEDFAQLKSSIEQIKYFEFGTNNSPENLNQGFTHCFNLTFNNEAERDVYLVHPAHLAFVERLKPWLAKVMVIDYFATSI